MNFNIKIFGAPALITMLLFQFQMTARMLESLTHLGSSTLIFIIRGWLSSFIWIVLAYFVIEMSILKTKIESEGISMQTVAKEILLKKRIRILITALIFLYESVIDYRTLVAQNDIEFIKEHSDTFSIIILIATVVRVLIDVYLYYTFFRLQQYFKDKKYNTLL
jgi:hypothetical protein